MRNPVISVLFAVTMIAVVVGVDLLFFIGGRWFWQRLAANAGIVLLFGTFYLRLPATGRKRNSTMNLCQRHLNPDPLAASEF
jgi:hypothetical protein